MESNAFEPASLFVPGKNCWRIEKASYASVLVDYGNYYRDLHTAICRAKKSIFIMGWDIDGRIELLRGDDAQNATAPVTFFELIKWKTENNPDLKIYLNKWDYSIFFAKEREPLAAFRWKTLKSENFHYCIDSMLPLGACHHQKVTVIDDEIAFCGGMDIALARWDMREHHPVNDDRYDPGGIFDRGKHIHYAPYHDLMLLTAGPAARALGELVRERWLLACKTPPVAMNAHVTNGMPESWPQGYTPDFKDVDIAISRTLPPVRRKKRAEEIIRVFIDQISTAEKFIYIENQFLVQMDIARALNKQLRNQPGLRVLAISCDHPKGVMERKSMWAPRIEFRKIIESGGVANRVALVYPISREDGKEEPVRIHSKLMIVDDKFLHLGSANINNRSMGMDTECDQIIAGGDAATRTKIKAVRTDLIREHSGREAVDIERLIDDSAEIARFLDEIPLSRQHFRRIDDEKYRHEKFVSLAKILSDPRRPLVTADLTISLTDTKFIRHISRPVSLIAIFCMLAAGLIYFWHINAFTNIDNVTRYLQTVSQSELAVPALLLIFIFSGFILFPVTLLIGVTSSLFGPVEGALISITGVLLAACAGYAAGRYIGSASLNKLFGHDTEKFKKRLERGGIMAVTLIRMVPLAPFGLVNIAFGAVFPSLTNYLIGSFLGALPGVITLSLLGDSLFKTISDPSPGNLGYIILAFAAWAAVILVSHYAEKKLRHGSAA